MIIFNKMNYPTEILFHICDYLDAYDLLSLEKTSRTLDTIVNGYIETKTTISSALLHFCRIKQLKLVDLRSQEARNNFNFDSDPSKPGFVFFHYSSFNYPIIVDDYDQEDLKRTHIQIKHNKDEKTLTFFIFDSWIRFLKVFNLLSNTWEITDESQMNQKLSNLASQSITNLTFCCFRPKHHKFFFHVSLGGPKYVYSLQIDKKLKQLRIESWNFVKIMKIEILESTIIKLFFTINTTYLVECVINYQQEKVHNLKFNSTYVFCTKGSVLLDDVIISKMGMKGLDELPNFENRQIKFSFH
jgi:hypothetical protein